MLWQSYNFAGRKKEFMTNLNQKLLCLNSLAQYMDSNESAWVMAQHQAIMANAWFNLDTIRQSVKNIVQFYLEPTALKSWAEAYPAALTVKTIGITMAGNIPLVGFHDFLCAYISGHQIRIKPSQKDTVLIKHLFEQLSSLDPHFTEQVHLVERLGICDAYIATGSNNSARYFEQYFAAYPHIIRRNRTSVAILEGSEDQTCLQLLAQDIFMYYGMGCRNVSQLYVPKGYDFKPLFEAFKPYHAYMHFHKYRNNYDYHLALFLLNKVPYLSDECILLVENEIPFSAVAVLHYQYYEHRETLLDTLRQNQDIQCIVGKGALAFGSSQQPSLYDYADGIDTRAFLAHLN